MKKLLCFLFLSFLFLPAMAWLAGLQFDCNVERIGYERPKFSGKLLLDRTFYRSFDRYFNDRFVLQDPLLLAKRWFEYRFFRSTDAEQVHVGRNHWLYHRQSIEAYRAETCKSEPAVAGTVLKLHALETMLAACGRTFLVMVAPSKTTLYPEYVGLTPRRKRCGATFYEAFLDALRRHPLEGFVRIDDRLQHVKLQGGPGLYEKDSRFWTGAGAAVALGELLNKLEVEPSARQLRLPLQQPGPLPDLRRALMGIAVNDDTAPHRRFAGAGDAALPAALVYGDGFVEPLLPAFRQWFGSLDVIQADRIPSVQLGENPADFDLVLLEVSESRLKSLQIDVTRTFQALAPKFAPLRKQPLDPGSIRTISGTSLRPSKQGTVLRANGVDARLAIDGLPGSSDTVFRMLKFRVSAHQSARWRLEFEGALPYRLQETLHAGTSEFLVPLPFASSLSLTVQPGTQPGLYTFTSIDIVSFPDPPPLHRPDGPPAGTVAFKPPAAPSAADSDAWMRTAPPKAGAGRDTGSGPVGDAGPVARAAATEIPAAEASPAPDPGLSVPPPVAACMREPDMNPVDDKTRPRRDDTSRKSTHPQRPSLTLSEFADGRIFQRIGKCADITVSGQYHGKPAPVEARVLRWDSGREVRSWAEIDSKPQNGMFVGVLPQVPQGGWYRLQVRSRDHPGRVEQGSARWGVGLLVACIGQSNMKEWFRTGTDLTANSLLRKYSPAGWERFEGTGNGALAFGNRITERLGIPVGILDFAVDGSGLCREADWGVGYWQDTAPGSIYRNFVDGVTEVGGPLEFVVWTQGEADAARATITENEYRTALENFIQRQVRVDVRNASERPQLPFLVVSMIKRPYGKDEPHQGIRNAQKRVAEQVADCYLAATTLDLENRGKEHLAPSAYITLGERVAQTVLYVLGLETYYRGPEVARAVQVDATTVEVTIRHRGGTDFGPQTDVTGWEVVAGEDSIPIETASKLNCDTLRIALGRPLPAPARIRYLYGTLPDTRRPVRDNSVLGLPLEEYQAVIYRNPR